MPLRLLTTILLLTLAVAAFAQDENPFQSIGKKGKILTLSKGKYDELFDQSDVQQIGTALVNMRTMKVVKLLRNENEVEKKLDNSTATRFLSIDPIAHSFPMLSPYQYASNSPIAGVDMDGLEFYFAADGSYLGQSKNGGTQIRVASEYSTYTQGTGSIAGKGFVFTKYKDIDKVDPKIAGKVYESIFKREVGGYLKSITVFNDPDRPNFSANTTAKGEFGVNQANVENGEKLNNDYFNVSATLYHENQHSEKWGTETADPFSHFGIERNVIENSGLFSKTSTNFQLNTKELLEGYLDEQAGSLRTIISQAHTDKSMTYSLKYYLKQYKSDIQYFNKKFGASKKEYDFKSYEKLIYANEKSVIPPPASH